MDVMVGRHCVLNVTAAASPPAGVGRTAPTSVAANSPSDGGWPIDVGTSSSDRHKTVSSAGSDVASDSSSVDDSVLGSIGSSFIVYAAATDGLTPFVCTRETRRVSLSGRHTAGPDSDTSSARWPTYAATSKTHR